MKMRVEVYSLVCKDLVYEQEVDIKSKAYVHIPSELSDTPIGRIDLRLLGEPGKEAYRNWLAGMFTDADEKVNGYWKQLTPDARREWEKIANESLKKES